MLECAIRYFGCSVDALAFVVFLLLRAQPLWLFSQVAWNSSGAAYTLPQLRGLLPCGLVGGIYRRWNSHCDDGVGGLLCYFSWWVFVFLGFVPCL